MQQLPQETLVAILGGVPCRQRLQACPRICKAWEVAAVQATTAHDVCARGYSNLDSFQAWLDKHAQQVVSLTFSGYSTVLGKKKELRLPCAKLERLQSLELSNCSPELTCVDGPRQANTNSSEPASALAGGAAAADSPALQQDAATAAALLPGLYSVSLTACRVSPDGLAVLDSAQLTKLMLTNVRTREFSTATYKASQAELAASIEAMLQQQPQLSVLQVANSGSLTAAALAAAAAMPLQELKAESMFASNTTEGADVLQLCTLPQLIALTLSKGPHGMVLAGSDSHALMAGAEPVRWSPGLQRLKLQSWAFEPAVLGGLAQAQLQHLHLSGCSLSPTHGAGVSVRLAGGALAASARTQCIRLSQALTRSIRLESKLTCRLLLPCLCPCHFQRDYVDTEASNTAALLDVLAGLTGLRSLQFDVLALAAISEQQLQRFSALTASIVLSSLRGSAYNTGQPLPQAALRHALSRPLPTLTELLLEAGDDEVAAGGARRRRDYRHQFCVEAADVEAIAANCPNLASLALVCVTPDDPSILASVAALGQRLSKLALGHWTGWLTDDSVSSLAALSGLRELEFKTAPKLSELRLLHLTALTGLRKLVAAECKLKPLQGSEFHWPGAPMGEGWAGTDECGDLTLSTSDKVRLWRMVLGWGKLSACGGSLSLKHQRLPMGWPARVCAYSGSAVLPARLTCPVCAACRLTQCAVPDVSRRLAQFLTSLPATSEYAVALHGRVSRLEARLAEARARLRTQAAELRALCGEPEPAAGGAAEEDDDGLGSTTGSEDDSEEEQPSSDDEGWW
jgi:hypothetical protein